MSDRNKIDVMHVSPVYNRNSILKHGLFPTKIELSHHLSAFQDKGICTKDGRILYTFEAVLGNSKFIRDHVYTMVWIHPRNKLARHHEERFGDHPDFSTITRTPLYPYSQMEFDIFKTEVSENEGDDSYIHGQYPSTNRQDTCFQMHEEFSHDDKPLRLFNYSIYPELVGKAIYRLEKHGKFTIKVIR